MGRKDNIFHSILKKEKGKLVYANSFGQKLSQEFVNSLDEGSHVEVFFDANKDDGTLAQLAKIHKCIRELAMQTGYTFIDMKLEIKNRAGLCVKKNIDGDLYMVCKSFGDCSREELSLAIEAIIELGDFQGMNLR